MKTREKLVDETKLVNWNEINIYPRKKSDKNIKKILEYMFIVN